tara:strand:- start:776 stop:1636 length:861 start_codon:yes stop_codon:yes gene_type:complete
MVVRRKPKQQNRMTKNVFKGNDKIIRNSILAILGTLAVLGTTQFVANRMRVNKSENPEKEQAGDNTLKLSRAPESLDTPLEAELAEERKLHYVPKFHNSSVDKVTLEAATVLWSELFDYPHDSKSSAIQSLVITTHKLNSSLKISPRDQVKSELEQISKFIRNKVSQDSGEEVARTEKGWEQIYEFAKLYIVPAYESMHKEWSEVWKTKWVYDYPKPATYLSAEKEVFESLNLNWDREMKGHLTPFDPATNNIGSFTYAVILDLLIKARNGGLSGGVRATSAHIST